MTELLILIDDRPDRGRRLIGLFCIAILCFDAIVIVEYTMQAGMQKFASNIIRFCLTAALFFWLYRGSNIARWIAFVCFGLGGLAGLYVIASAGRWNSRHIPMIACFLLFAWTLALSPDVRAYIAETREKRHARKAARSSKVA